MSTNEKAVQSILATDCGSTDRKAILIEKQGDDARLVARGDTDDGGARPSTTSPWARNAAAEVEDLTGKRLLEAGRLIVPARDSTTGTDLYLSTSSAGGGLQMMVAGVVRSMSGESAQRAALGAGAIIMDVIAVDDGRREYQRVERIRNLRPDMILLSGGTDGGTVTSGGACRTSRRHRPAARLGSGCRFR